MTPASVLLGLALAVTSAALAAAEDDAGSPGDGTRDVIFLAEDRPVFLRMRLTIGGRPLAAAWADSVATLRAFLDRNGDGTLTTNEADSGALPALVRLATGDATALPRVELDGNPKDGVVSTDELAEALRLVLGPFRVQVGRLADGRTDALFDHLDRDKDGQLTRSELAAIAGSLRRLDLDDNEMLGADELEPFRNPAVMAAEEGASGRRGRYTALPPVVERVAGESSLRLARLLLKKYDKGRGDLPGPPDGKVSNDEFAIAPDVFTRADTNRDGFLGTEELRRFVARTPSDLVLDIDFSPNASGRATTRVGGNGVLPEGTTVRQLADGDVEFAVGKVRLDIHVDDGAAAADNARRILTRQLQAADANKDGYLEPKELAADGNSSTPLAGLFDAIDRDGDGKVYLKEMVAFADRQTDAARGRLVLTASDQGRAIFGILDLNRDRRLGAREVLRTVERVTSWDGDRDGRVSADEIPYHFQVTIARNGLAGLADAGVGAANAPRRPMAEPQPAGPAAGPKWFRQMDRNRDGDISRREFLGPREQFDRLDRDRDGLIDADEASAVTATAREGTAAP